MFGVAHAIDSARGPCRLQAVGEMDVFGAAYLRRCIYEHAPTGCHELSVDLSAISWVNGSALAHLARTRATLARDLDVEVDLVCWSASVAAMSSRAHLGAALGVGAA